jgi:hypothetical protein
MDANKLTTDRMTGLYSRIAARLETCTMKRNSLERGSKQAIMLAGKCKAYCDVLTLMKDKYSGHIAFTKLLPRLKMGNTPRWFE